MKPLKETAVGKFLLGKGMGHLLEGLADTIPGARVLEHIKLKAYPVTGHC